VKREERKGKKKRWGEREMGREEGRRDDRRTKLKC
jgi:hypothetical protein